MAPGKRKNTKDQWMPPRVYRGRSAYEWHPKGGGNIRLCGLDATESEVWQAYRNAESHAQKAVTIATLIEDYLASPQFLKRKPNTQADYKNSAKKLKAVFGKLPPDNLKPHHVREYMDRRGTVSEVRANRERSFLASLYSWARERNKASVDPVRDVKPFPEQSRDRYVTDDEYKAVYDVAPVQLQIAMEIAYLCAARQGDILALRWGKPGQTEPERGQNAVVLKQGIYIKQGKTGKPQIKLWSPRLKAALERAKKIKSDIASVWVIRNRKGQPYTRPGFKSMYRRAMFKWLGENAKADHPLWFTFHDLKAKGATDAGAQGRSIQEFTGHSSRKMAEVVYNRLPDQVQALDKDRL